MHAMKRFYTFGSILPFEEDKTHEFKAHKNICVEDLPRWAFIKGTLRRSRRAVSRTLNGFLNTGVGGTVYLGVLDNGMVKGMTLTPHQRDHIRLAVEDVFSRYRPTVPPSRYQVEFVPVVARGLKSPHSHALASPGLDDSGYTSSGSGDDSGEAGSSPPPLSAGAGNGRSKADNGRSKLQQFSHKLRCPNFCWCEVAAFDLAKQGEIIPSFVVEITVHPFQYRKGVDPMVLQLHPLYEDEEGRVYMRGSASLHQMTYQEVAQMTERQASAHFERVLRSLHEELLALHSQPAIHNHRQD